MPGRLNPLINGEIYHVFNRGIDHRPTFTDIREYQRGLKSFEFYRFRSPPTRLSYFLNLANEEQDRILSELLERKNFLTECLSHCLMPNHFHFLFKQLTENGISKFMSKFQNSYTRYFNTKHNNRIGPLFLDQFKAVRIETEEQLVHVSRYIHLNPYTSFVVKEIEDLLDYPWASFTEYLGKVKNGVCNTEIILSAFKNKGEYKRFVFDQADYQRDLEKIKHLTLEQGSG